MKYNPNEIEKKWQEFWKKHHTFKAENNSHKPKYYALDMFPYPSGAGLHVGHPLGYIASDIVSRYKRHQGFNVLHPMGYDSFGLPAEQYAIQTGQHPAITTETNIKRYREQLDKIGFSFDWEREIRTSNPNYYKWTQWIFIQLFNSWYCKKSQQARPIDELIEAFETNGNLDIEAETSYHEIFAFDQWNSFTEKEKADVLLEYRLTYLAEAEVNWCPELGTVLANDEVINGVSERGGFPVIRKKMTQWMMRITAYSERLLQGLNTIDWPEPIKESQRNWIGKSKGASIIFPLSPKGGNKLNNKFGYMTGGNNAHLLLDKAKEMRQNPTKAEKVLWENIKSKKLGYKFRQQHLIEDFIVDFVCLNKKLVIEVDGEIHNSQIEYDEQRTLILNSLGYEVIRFRNEEVLNHISEVLSKINNKLNSIVLPLGDRGIEVFTTRPDTIFGVSYMTLAPEHDLVLKITTNEYKDKVQHYIEETAKRSERERMSDVKTISGQFTGAYAIHPFTEEKIPIWIGDYVLAGYGTGAVMAVPAGDERDYAFAKYFDLPIKNIFDKDISENAFTEKENFILENSDFLTGLNYKEATEKIITEIENKKIGKGKINYRLRDAVFSRQRYWGEPIPIYYKNGIPHAIPNECLPLELPEVEKYLPTETGEPPLGRAEKWAWHTLDQKVVECSLINEVDIFPLELNTMPGWAGSSWYFNRYMDSKNQEEAFSKEANEYWQQVDLYLGGSEHATGHLLYSRFWQKFLFDLDYVSYDEYAKKLINQGMILGNSAFIYRKTNESIFISANQGIQENYLKLHVDISLINEQDNSLNVEAFRNWREEYKNAKFITEENGKFYVSREVEKMSKSKYNVVNPDEICEEYGADTLRMYEMFLGPIEQAKPWNTQGLSGVFGFLKKFWKLYHHTEIGFDISDEIPTKEEYKILHQTIKKVTEDIENFSFNTSISTFMIAVNELTKLKCNKRKILEELCILISPFAPHIAEEIWWKIGNTESISTVQYPKFDEQYLVENTKNYPVSFNGKMRFTMELSLDLSKEEVEEIIMKDERTQKQLEGRIPKKFIYIPGKIINLVG
ncbi:MAG: leucine--tRNA ligase [Flavobacteriales bacterium]|nr:leucine--tRNA ligase [Flavobacteriales bacterium]